MSDLTGATTQLQPGGWPGAIYGDFSGKTPAAIVAAEAITIEIPAVDRLIAIPAVDRVFDIPSVE
jgi:hypothetical protein